MKPGAKEKYGEPTIMVSFRCPKSQVKPIKNLINQHLKKCLTNE